MFDRILIANRGEIARRINRTCRRLGVETVAIYSTAEANALHTREATCSVLIGDPPPSDSYLNIANIVAAALKTGAEAIHPGYGFLSENAQFARAVEAAGLIWIGPSPTAIESMGDKTNARNLMAAAGIPVSPGSSEAVLDVEQAVREAAQIGYPVMVKPSAGGGGIGMTTAWDEAELRRLFETASTRAAQTFGNAAILLERFFPAARHVEVQIVGMRDGTVLALGERDCSVQRRHQKVAEETPAPALDDGFRAAMLAAAIAAGKAVNYLGAGTVEFLVSGSEFVFLEMNTRLQVEHAITEMVTGIDLVEAQLKIAANDPVALTLSNLSSDGCAIEFRVYAEDPKRFLPRPGTITAWDEPAGDGVRVDSGYASGDTVTQFYDPLVAKLCVWGTNRRIALERAAKAITTFRIDGIQTNLPFLAELVGNPAFVSGNYSTDLVSTMRGSDPRG